MRRNIETIARLYFSNFGSLKSTETHVLVDEYLAVRHYFSNFGSLKSTETHSAALPMPVRL